MDMSESAFYEIRVKGHLDSHWLAWFDDMAVTTEENGETILAGPIQDQPALHGLLVKIRDLGMPLLSVQRKSAHDPITADH